MRLSAALFIGVAPSARAKRIESTVESCARISRPVFTRSYRKGSATPTSDDASIKRPQAAHVLHKPAEG
eukprot:COSAG01_NODE_7286_length_3269_cov_0.980126_1_plen_69_part_00